MPIVYVNVKDERLTEFINILSQHQFGDYRVFRDLNDTEIPASFGSKDKKGRIADNGTEGTLNPPSKSDEVLNGYKIQRPLATKGAGSGRLNNNFAIAALAMNNLASTSLGSDLRSGISGSDSILMQYSQGTGTGIGANANYNNTPMQTVQDFLSSEMKLKDGTINIPTNSRLRKQGLVRNNMYSKWNREKITLSLQCKICNEFVNCAPKHKRNCMRSHATTRHMEIKRFKCSECEFATKAHSSMKSHFKLHEGIDCRIIDLWNEDLEKQQAEIARACFPSAFDCGARWDQFVANKKDAVSMLDM